MCDFKNRTLSLKSFKLYNDNEVKEMERPSIATVLKWENEEMIELIIKQSSNPESIVLDCFCGSGITLKAANSLGRKFIGIDCSKLAIEVSQASLQRIDYQYLSMNKSISEPK